MNDDLKKAKLLFNDTASNVMYTIIINKNNSFSSIKLILYRIEII